MGRIAPRKNTSPDFSLPGLDGLREKWRRRFGPDDDVSRPAFESDERALTGESVKRTSGQNTGAQDSLPAASTEDAALRPGHRQRRRWQTHLTRPLSAATTSGAIPAVTLAQHQSATAPLPMMSPRQRPSAATAISLVI